MKSTIFEKIASIALIAILAISMFAIAISHAAVISIPTFLEIQVSPNPVGIGQPIYMQVFLSKPTATAGMNSVGDLYKGITLAITAPNGDVTHMGPYTADATGGIPSLEFTPSQLGNYTFQANYPGQTLTSGTTYAGDTESPSVSQIDTVTVQQAPIPTVSSPPLPNAYWDFPIEATNYGWSVLGGNWLGLAPETFAVTGDYDATGNFNPYTTAPTTAHIMWSKATTLGGQIGGPIPGDEMHNFMTTTIISDFFEPIIMQGMLIYADYNTLRNNQAYWQAVDLATGETVWTESPGIGAPPSTLASPQNPNMDVGGQTNAESLRMGEVLSSHSMQEYGSMAVLYSTSGTTWRLYSAFNGMYLGNITGAGSASYIQDNNPNDASVGSILGYFVGSGNLTLWNSTLCWGNGVSYQEMLRPPTTVAWSKGDQWNVTLPTTFNGNPISPALSISRITHDVILLRSAPSFVTYDSVGYAVEAGYSALTGQQLWMHNVTIPEYHYDQVLAAGEDVYVLEDKDATTEYGYSMTNGSLLWGPTQLPYNALSTLSQAADIAYGNVYTFDLGGYCTAINLATGKIAWVYQSPSAGYNTPYGVYPIWQFGSASIRRRRIVLLAVTHV